MKQVGIRDLKNRATRLLREDEILIIQRHGKDVGIYLPLTGLDDIPLEVRLRLFRRVTDEIAAAAGDRRISEDALVRRFRSMRARKRRGR